MPAVARSSPGTTHHNTVVLPKAKIFFQLFPGILGADSDRGIANAPFTLKVNGRLVAQGQTAADGSVTVFTLPASGDAILEVLGTEYKLLRAPLEPVTDPAGVQRRLQMLGYQKAPVLTAFDINAEEALLNFQGDSPPVDPNGNLGADTQAKLTSAFGE